MTHDLTSAGVRLGCNPKLVKALIDSGELPAIQLGPRKITIYEEDLNEFIERRKKETLKAIHNRAHKK